MTRSERGSGSVLLMIGVVLLVPVVVAGLTVAQVLIAHRQAAGAADLAALAGASAHQRGLPPCDQAEGIAARNGARVVSCDIQGSVVVVSTRIQVEGPFGLTFPVTARASAGPSDEPVGPGLQV